MLAARCYPWLLPVSWIYGGVVALRNARFDRLPGTSIASALPVISIGNITVGGTGKTPAAIEIAGRLRKIGRRPAILTRGYGADAGQTADEVLEFQQALPGTSVLVDADRVESARRAADERLADCLVMDDGFQHRRLRRDLDIVLVDGLDPWGGGWLLPAGRLREPLASLARAGLFVLTRANQAESATLDAVRAVLRRCAPGVPVLLADVVADQLRRPDGSVSDHGELVRRRVLAACGLGNPATFEASLEARGAAVVATRRFRDHHRYTPADAASIARAARDARADWVVTTRKDWGKLRPLWTGAALGTDVPLLACLEVRMQIDDPNGLLDRLLQQALERRS